MLRLRLLQAFRIGIILAIAWLVHRHHARLRSLGNDPIRLEEVQAILPEAVAMAPDTGPTGGVVIALRNSQQTAYAVRTLPRTEKIRGYAGPADVLIVFAPDERVRGIALRSSADTPGHIEDVVNDPRFMSRFNGRTAAEISRIRSLTAAGIYGVTGASRTSECMAESVVYRVAHGWGEAPPLPFHLGLADVALLLTVVGGCIFAFGHGAWRKKWRGRFQWALIFYVGIVAGDLLAQSLFAGWVSHGIPWRFTPGLVLLATASLLVPATTGKPLYCGHLCPHGAVQEKLGARFSRRWKIPGWLMAALRWIPGYLLALVLISVILELPLDLAEVEAFDGWLWPSIGGISALLLLLGFVASTRIPMAYCHIGCPTGALLRFIRSHGRADRFRFSDGVGVAFLLLTVVLTQDTCNAFIQAHYLGAMP